MIGKCLGCGAETTRYGGESIMSRACDYCGSFIFNCLHFGYAIGPGHHVVVDLRTGKALSHDECNDNIRNS